MATVMSDVDLLGIGADRDISFHPTCQAWYRELPSLSSQSRSSPSSPSSPSSFIGAGRYPADVSGLALSGDDGPLAVARARLRRRVDEPGSRLATPLLGPLPVLPPTPGMCLIHLPPTEENPPVGTTDVAAIPILEDEGQDWDGSKNVSSNSSWTSTPTLIHPLERYAREAHRHEQLALFLAVGTWHELPAEPVTPRSSDLLSLSTHKSRAPAPDRAIRTLRNAFAYPFLSQPCGTVEQTETVPRATGWHKMASLPVHVEPNSKPTGLER